jgi:hypothetical protein
MISVRFLHREEWEAKLRGYGCKPLEGKGRLNTAELWQMPWGGYPFTVPIEDDGRCDEWAIRRLIADIVKAAPEGWKFPDD